MIKDYQPKVVWAIIEADTAQHPDHTIFLSSGKRILQKMLFGLLPSFVQRRVRPLSSKQQRLHPTSYLDGLRGVASFIVFMGHYTEENLGWYTEPYGMYEDGAPSSPLQLPLLRVLYSARPMVHIFFIISGYVLAYKPLKQIHNQQYSSLAGTLASSVFRRALRLFLPSIITLLIMAIAVYSGFSDDRYAGQFFQFTSQIQHWWYTSWDLVNASWAINDLSYPQPMYNPALWTIPVEFAQSLLLFTVLIGLSRCLSHIRLLLLAGIMAFCFYGGQLYSVEFLGGMFIAEMTLLHDASLFTPVSSPTLLPKFAMEEKQEKSDCGPTIKSRLVQAFWIANLLCGLFIASWTNNHPEEVWGIAFLDAHTPEPYEGQKVWFCFGAFQIVIACTQVSLLQRIFNTHVAQYLGSISYALYLTHNLCLTSLEPRIAPAIDFYFSKATFWGRQISWGVGLVVYLPIIIWVADLFWRAIDTPTVKFARWLEGKCIVEKMS
jgi:peptidoglycan/LPS O-acetylase OafA/YrhL